MRNVSAQEKPDGRRSDAFKSLHGVRGYWLVGYSI